MVALALLVLGCWLCSAPSRAEQAVTVLVLQPVEADMLQRVQGQLADKSARVLAVQAVGRTPVERAFRAARQHGAALVVWFSDERGFAVNVLDVRRSRLVERAVPPPQSGEVMGRSARDEAAAFIVRGAVEDIGEGRSVGRPVAPPPPPQLEPKPCPAAPQLAPVPARFHALADGLATLRGPELGLLHRRPHFTWAVLGRLSYASTLERAGFSLDVARYDLRALGSYALISSRLVELAGGVAFGPSLHRRATRAVPDGFLVAPSSLEPDLFLGVFGAAAFQLAPSGVRLRVALGIEAGLGERDLLVQGRGEPLESAWPVQPFAQLSLVFPVL